MVISGYWNATPFRPSLLVGPSWPRCIPEGRYTEDGGAAAGETGQPATGAVPISDTALPAVRLPRRHQVHQVTAGRQEEPLGRPGDGSRPVRGRRHDRRLHCKPVVFGRALLADGDSVGAGDARRYRRARSRSPPPTATRLGYPWPSRASLWARSSSASECSSWYSPWVSRPPTARVSFAAFLGDSGGTRAKLPAAGSARRRFGLSGRTYDHGGCTIQACLLCWTVGGHEILLVGGHESPRWWPRKFLVGGHQISLMPVR